MQDGKGVLNFLQEAGFKATDPMTIHQDNLSTIHIATNPMQFTKRTKHIDIKMRFIEEAVEKGVVKLVYCPTENMVADILTKALPPKQFKYFRSLLGVRSLGEIDRYSASPIWSLQPRTSGC